MRNIQKWGPPALIGAAVVVVVGLALATMTVGGNAAPGWLVALLLVVAAAWLARRPRQPLPPSLQERLGADLAKRGVMHAVAGTIEEAPTQELSPTPEPTPANDETNEPEEVTRMIATRRVKASLFAPTLAFAVAIAGTVLVAALNNPTYGMYALALCVAYGLREVAPLLVRFFYWATGLVNRIAQAFGKGKKGRTILWLKGIGTLIIVAVVVVLAKDFLGAIAPMVFAWLTGLVRATYEFLAWILTDLTRTMVTVSAVTSMRLGWYWLDWSQRWTVLTDEVLTLEWGIIQRQSISMPRKGMVPDERHVPGTWWCLAKADSPAQDDAAFDRLPWMPRKFWKEVTS